MARWGAAIGITVSYYTSIGRKCWPMDAVRYLYVHEALAVCRYVLVCTNLTMYIHVLVLGDLSNIITKYPHRLNPLAHILTTLIQHPIRASSSRHRHVAVDSLTWLSLGLVSNKLGFGARLIHTTKIAVWDRWTSTKSHLEDPKGKGDESQTRQKVVLSCVKDQSIQTGVW